MPHNNYIHVVVVLLTVYLVPQLCGGGHVEGGLAVAVWCRGVCSVGEEEGAGLPSSLAGRLVQGSEVPQVLSIDVGAILGGRREGGIQAINAVALSSVCVP